MDKKLLLKQYYSHLIAQERRALLTAETYRFEIRRFLDWLEEKKSGAGTRTEFSDVSEYLDFRKTVDRIDSRSLAKAVSALKSFFRFLRDGRIMSNISGDGASMGGASIVDRISLLESPRSRRRLPAVLKNSDAERALEQIDTQTPLGLRNRAIYELIYSAGLRVSELVALNVQDLLIKEGIARVTGKGSKERLVIFDPETALWLKRYLEEVRPLFLRHRRSPAFFVSRSGRRLSRKGIWKNYRAIAFNAGVDTKLHTLRHTFATEMLSGGADLRSVQELLGHADLATTQIYTHIDSSYLRENHRQFLPELKAWREA